MLVSESGHIPQPRRPPDTFEPCAVTIIVPTFNEGTNIQELIRRVNNSVSERATEMLFVDDSTDDTPEVIQRLARTSGLTVRLLHRPIGQRSGGLASAVTAGLSAARGRVAVVMDGDLQHPPELIPELLHAMTREGVQLVVASRYCGSGDASGLAGGLRRHVSKASTGAARAMFPRAVGRRCTDPMTGFFCIDRTVLNLGRLQASGFKILLEILVSHDLRTTEIPFAFAERHSGDSKASWRRGAEFCWQLLRLRFNEPIVRFAAVGVIGALLNLAIMALLMAGGVGYLLAAIVGSEVTIATNFILQERFVFHESSAHRAFWVRVVHTFGVNNAELLIRIPILALLVKYVHLSELAGAAAALLLAFAGRYLFLSKVTYRRRSRRLDSHASHRDATYQKVA